MASTKSTPEKSERPKKRGRPPKVRNKKSLTAEDIVPVMEIQECVEGSSDLVTKIPAIDLEENNINDLTDIDFQNLKLSILQTVSNLNEKIRSNSKLLKDHLKKHRKIDTKARSVIQQVENVKQTIRLEHHKLSEYKTELANSEFTDLSNRSPLLRWIYATIFRNNDRIVLKSRIAILEEKINMRSLHLNDLERKQASLLLMQKTCDKVIRNTEASYDSLLESRQRLQSVATQMEQSFSSMEIKRTRTALFNDYRESIRQLNIQTNTDKAFLEDIREDQIKVQKFLDAVDHESNLQRPLQDIIKNLNVHFD